MSVLSLAPLCLRSVEAARHTLQRDGWTIETIADDIEADLVWTSAPHNILGLVTIERRRAVVTIAEHVRDSDLATLAIGRMLAEVIAANAAGRDRHMQIVTRNAWRHDKTRRPYWSGGLMLAVSLADVHEMIAGDATPHEIARRRNVPPWLAKARIQQEILYGDVDGDVMAAAMQALSIGERLLAELAVGKGMLT